MSDTPLNDTPVLPTDPASPPNEAAVVAPETPTVPADAVPPPALASDKFKWARTLLREILETILLTAIIYFAVNAATGRYRVEGESMYPTLLPGENVLIDKVSYTIGQPQRGDIIVFEYPYASDERDFIKRVIGLPGETVDINSGVISINGSPLTEPYPIPAMRSADGHWTLSATQYFVMGDNRNNSSDSRAWGPLERSYFIGRALLVYWPIENWQFVPHYDYDK